MAITKNKQSDETIKKMAFAAFPQKEVKTVFDEVKEPALVHWDMWKGNVL